MTLVFLGILAACLQALGYLAYGIKVLKRDISPNPASWLMFAYGTTLLLFLEWDRDATPALLALPAVCAVASIAVAYYCLRRGKRSWWPEHTLERLSFILDIGLTVAYVSAWTLLANSYIAESQKDLADIMILACWNIGIFTAFYPLLRQVYHHPTSEHPLAWTIWTLAYFILFVLTIMETGALNELAIYPAVNALVHGSIAVRVGLWHWQKGLSVV